MRAMLLGFLVVSIAVVNSACTVMSEGKGHASGQKQDGLNLKAADSSPGKLAEECQQAFVFLLNLDLHDQGVSRFKNIGGPAGPFLLDAMLNRPEFGPGGELRDRLISRALAYCLTPEVEERLIQIVRDQKADTFHRRHAMRALASGETEEAKAFIIAEFKRVYMTPRNEDQDEPHASMLVAAAGRTGSPEVFEGLRSIMNEVRKTSYIFEVLRTIHALSDLDDPRGIPVLRDLLEDERWGHAMAPRIYMALIELGDENAYADAMTARKSGEWTDHHRELFDMIEKYHEDSKSR